MSGYEETVYPLPKGWAWSTLGECAALITKGESPKWQGFDYVEIGVLFIRSENVLWGSVEVGKAARVPRQFHEKLRRSQLKGKDLLVNLVGASIGRCAVLPQTIIEGNVNQAVGVVRFEDKWIRPEYVRDWLLTPVMQHHINGQKVETARANISLEDLRSMPIPLAPAAEQDRIIFTIDQLLTQLDSALRTLKRVQLQLRRYRQSVLKHAVEGKLTEEWRQEHKGQIEPADELLKRILTERRAKWEEQELAKMTASGKVPKDQSGKKKYKEPEQPNTEGLPELPAGWCWATAEQLSQLDRSITYGVIKLGEPASLGIPTLRSSNVRHLYLEIDTVKKISPLIAANYQRTVLKGGEILVTVRGTLGGVAAVPETCAGFNISREVAMIAPAKGICAEAIAFLIGSKPIQDWLQKNTRGIAYTGINIETLKALPIPLPPLKEQDALLTETERCLAVARSIHEDLAKAARKCDRLRQSILAAGFSGKLVPHDPNDEPAAILLERIRAEREKEVDGKRKVRESPKSSRTGGPDRSTNRK